MKNLLSTLSYLMVVSVCYGFTNLKSSSIGRRPQTFFRYSLDLPGTVSFSIPQDVLNTYQRPKTNDNTRGINHRHSAKDWLHNVASLPKSTVLHEISSPVLVTTFWSTAVSIVHRILSSSQSAMLQKVASDMCVGPVVHSFLMSSLGLLLVFRTNSAYQRFNEGRKIWEQILSLSRNLSRMLMLYEKELGNERSDRLRRVLASFPYLLRHHIRPRCLNCKDVPNEFKLKLIEPLHEMVQTRHEGDKNHGGIWQDHDDRLPTRNCYVDKRNFPWSLMPENVLNTCSKALNRPLWACDYMSKLVYDAPNPEKFTSRERLTMIGQIDKLSNAIGECERIHQTAVPLNYARHCLRSLTLWLLTLPFACVRDLGLLTGPVCGVVSWVLFGVYQIGHSIEDPFQKTLRLSILCNAIRQDVMGESMSNFSAFRLEDPAASQPEPTKGIEEAQQMFEEFHQTFVPLSSNPNPTDTMIMSSPRLKSSDGNLEVLGAS